MTIKEMMKARIPVTIISGFLGSGKTTLLNRIVSESQGLRVAVIVNDLGEINIDNELILSTNGGVMEISNGCICCSNNDDLRGTVRTLLRRADEIDYLVIESTGVGDPLPIMKTFTRPEFLNVTRVDSVITVVDGEHLLQSIAADPVTHRQIAHADFILLNKCDLVAEGEVAVAKGVILKLNHKAKLAETVRCAVPLPLILGVALHKEGAAEDGVPSHECGAVCHLAGERVHDFSSVSFSAEGAIDPERFQRFLENLPSTVFRAKGFLRTSVSQQRYVFHLIARRFTLDPTDVPSDPDNRLVFIGKDMDSERLVEDLSKCMV
jgi:G3E family GTPase